MSKNLKHITVAAIVLVILGGMLAVLKLTGGSDDSSTDSSSVDDTQSKTALSEWKNRFDSDSDSDITEDNIISVEIQNSYSDYIVIPSDNDDSESTYTIQNLEHHKFDSSLLSSMPASALTLSLIDVIAENTDEMSKYGLDSPQAKITVTLDDDSQFTYLIGDVSPVSTQTYVCFEDDNTIYTAYTTTINAFLYDEKYYISKTVIEEPAEDESDSSSEDEDSEDADDTDFENIRISRSDLDYDFLFEYDHLSKVDKYSGGTSSDYFMSEPIFSYLDVEKSYDYTHLYGLTADSIYSLDPSDEQLSELGFDNPFCQVYAITIVGQEYTLKLVQNPSEDSSEDAAYLGIINGSSVIYGFAAETVPWTTLTPSDVHSTIIVGEYFYSLSHVEVHAQDRDSLIFDSSGTDSDSFTATLNGSSTDVERFRKFYTFLINTSAEEIFMGEVSGEPVAEIVVDNQNGRHTQLQFYDIGSRKLAIKVNGVVSFKCRSAYLEVLLNNIDNYDSTSDFIYTW